MQSPTLECPRPAPCLPECPSVPGVPNPRVSLPTEGGDVRSKIIYFFILICAFTLFFTGSEVHVGSNMAVLDVWAHQRLSREVVEALPRILRA